MSINMIKFNISDELNNKVFDYCGLNFPAFKENHFGAGFKGNPNRDPVGIMGEITVVRYFNRDIDEYLANRPVGKSDRYDVPIKGRVYDVKTKNQNYPPEPYYDQSVNAEQFIHGTNIDGYIFCSLLYNWSSCFIDGYMSRDEFSKKAKYYAKGDKQVKGKKIFEFLQAAYNITVAELHDFKELVHE